MSRYLVVMNSASGAGPDLAPQRREVLERVLSASGCAFELLQVDSPRDLEPALHAAAERAKRQGEILVAVGGDGTITAAAQAAHRSGCVMGAIPQGTFNYFCRAHGISQDLEEATRSLLRASPEPVHVGTINGRLFLVNASLGMYPQLLHDREAFVDRLGRRRWVALLAALATLFKWRHQLSLDVEVDGQLRRLRTPTLFVGNNALQLGRLGLAPELVREVGKGRMAAIVVRPIGTMATLALVLRGALGRLGDADQVESFAFQRLTVRIRGVRRTRVAADGELGRMSLPIQFEVCPEPLMLMLPCAQDRVAVA